MGSIINDPDCKRRLLMFRISDAVELIVSAEPYIGYKRMREIQSIVEDGYGTAMELVLKQMDDRIEENVANAFAAWYVVETMLNFYDFSKLHNAIELIELGEVGDD